MKSGEKTIWVERFRRSGKGGWALVGETNDSYWARQLSFATLFGFVVLLASFVGGCIGFISYFNYALPHSKRNGVLGFYFALPTALFLGTMVFGLVMWRGYVRRKQELALEEMGR